MNAHEHMVADVCKRQGAVTRGFRAQLRDVVDSDLRWFIWRPDAFSISQGLVTVYEVEDTHRLDIVKLKAYAQLWQQLQIAELELRLVVMDIRGGVWEPNLALTYFHA